jgi:hypothetical protein
LPNSSLLFFLYRDPLFYSEVLHLADKRANEMERILKASEEDRKKAEQEAVSVGDL